MGGENSVLLSILQWLFLILWVVYLAIAINSKLQHLFTVLNIEIFSVQSFSALVKKDFGQILEKYVFALVLFIRAPNQLFLQLTTQE